MIENVQHGTFLIDADLKPFVERYVSDDHTKPDRNQKQRLPVLSYGHDNDDDTAKNHQNMKICHVGKPGIFHELHQSVKNSIHTLFYNK